MAIVYLPRERVVAIEPVEGLSSDENALISRFRSMRKNSTSVVFEHDFFAYWDNGGEVVAYRLGDGTVILAPPNPEIEPGMGVVARQWAGHVSNRRMSVWWAWELVEDRRQA